MTYEPKWGNRIYMQREEPLYHIGINANERDHSFTFLVWLRGESTPTASVKLSKYEAEELADAILDTLGSMVVNRPNRLRKSNNMTEYYGSKACTRCGHQGKDHDHDWSDRLEGPDIFRCEILGCKCEKYTDWEDEEPLRHDGPGREE